MTVPIELTNSPPETFVSGLSRYRRQTPIYYGEQRLLTFDLYLREDYVRTGSEKVMVITKGVEYRPDLVAADVYGVAEAWWKIMEVNKMRDILDFKAGITIFLPEDLL